MCYLSALETFAESLEIVELDDHVKFLVQGIERCSYVVLIQLPGML